MPISLCDNGGPQGSVCMRQSKPMFFVVTLKIYEIDLSKSKPEAMMFENVYSPAEENV